jgi:hypothetical protein
MADAVQLSRPIAGSDELTRRTELLVAPSSRGMRPAERLDIYREQFWLRHLSNLRDDFPTVEWAIGPEPFERLCTEYLGAFPPKTWDLQRLGANLPAFAASHAPWQDDAFASEAARLDWAFRESHGAPDARPFDPQALASAPEDAWPRARIGLHPSVRSLALAYPLHAVRAALKQGPAPPRPCMQPTGVVVWRDAQYSVRAVAVDRFALALLTELEAGTPLGLACENAARSDGIEAQTALGERVGACFQEWTAAGWVSMVTFPA